MTTPTLTAQQRAALAALTDAATDLTPRMLATALGTSPEGAARTAASLVRRGLVERHRSRLGLTYYRPTTPEEATR